MRAVALFLAIAATGCARGARPEVYTVAPTGASLPGFAFPCEPCPAGFCGSRGRRLSPLAVSLPAWPGWCVEVG